MEEAGARGRLGRNLGTFADSDRKHRTTVFVLHIDPENGGLVDDFEEKVRLQFTLQFKLLFKNVPHLYAISNYELCIVNFRTIVLEDGFRLKKPNLY